MERKQLLADADQQNAIDIDKNAVISAGAGSGKTTVLAARYLRLVLEGKAGVENILTLTFTRKAAQEMRSRIYGLLLEHSDPRVQEQLALFDRSQISTLDSFCAQIAGNWTQRFGIAPDFTVDEDAAADDARRVALDFLLENSDDAALSELIYLNRFDQVLEDFLVPFALSHISAAGELDFSSMLEKQKRIIAEELENKLSALDAMRKSIDALKPGSKTSVKNAIRAVAGLENARLFAKEGRLDELEELLIGFSVRKPPQAKDPEVITVRELVGPLRDVAGELADLVTTLKTQPLIERLLDLCEAFQKKIIAQRRSRGVLLYHDVARMARTCLLENIELRKYYKRRFTHIMIDEFQDNNRLQKEILYLLAERDETNSLRVPEAGELDPDKLFFVGDEKQSIYMFRGADVSVFKELSEELENEGGKALSLPKNYRAEPGLIAFLNQVFERLMGDASRPFEARFQALEHRDAQLTMPSIRLLYKAAADTKDDTLAGESDAEAIAVARFIQDAVVNRRLEVSSDEGTRPAGYDDFALLMRSTSNQNRYERAFRIMGIPHTVDSTRSLFLESPVNDIFHLLQLTVYPEDRPSYAALLRSPLVNVSDNGFLTLLLSDDPSFSQRALAQLDEKDGEKLKRAASMYAEICAKADTVPITELLSCIWYEYGYRYLLLKNPALHPYLEYYDYLRELARKADRSLKSIAGFLDMIRPHLGKYERIGELEVLKDDELSAGGVRIFTVHRAKGLEFPVVIFADAGNRGRSSDSGSPFYYSDELGLTFNIAQSSGRRRRKSNYFYSRGKEEQEQKEMAETKRLLYVALTRAENHLVISGRHNKSNRKSDQVPLNMVLTALGWEPGTEVCECKALEPFLSIIPDVPAKTLYTYQPGPTEQGIPPVEKALQLYREAGVTENPASPPEWTASDLEASVVREWKESSELPGLASDTVLAARELQADFGTLCHSLIEDKLGMRPNGYRITPKLRMRLDSDELESVVREANGLVSRFFTSPAGRLLDGAFEVETEVPFLLSYERNDRRAYISGVIDLLVEKSDEIIIIDFKTDRLLRNGEYHIQAEVYREAVMQWTDKQVRCFIVYLRNNSLVEVPCKPLPDFFSITGFRT